MVIIITSKTVSHEGVELTFDEPDVHLEDLGRLSWKDVPDELRELLLNRYIGLHLDDDTAASEELLWVSNEHLRVLRSNQIGKKRVATELGRRIDGAIADYPAYRHVLTHELRDQSRVSAARDVHINENTAGGWVHRGTVPKTLIGLNWANILESKRVRLSEAEYLELLHQTILEATDGDLQKLTSMEQDRDIYGSPRGSFLKGQSNLLGIRWYESLERLYGEGGIYPTRIDDHDQYFGTWMLARVDDRRPNEVVEEGDGKPEDVQLTFNDYDTPLVELDTCTWDDVPHYVQQFLGERYPHLDFTTGTRASEEMLFQFKFAWESILRKGQISQSKKERLMTERSADIVHNYCQYRGVLTDVGKDITPSVAYRKYGVSVERARPWLTGEGVPRKIVSRKKLLLYDSRIRYRPNDREGAFEALRERALEVTGGDLQKLPDLQYVRDIARTGDGKDLGRYLDIVGLNWAVGLEELFGENSDNPALIGAWGGEPFQAWMLVNVHGKHKFRSPVSERRFLRRLAEREGGKDSRYRKLVRRSENARRIIRDRYGTFHSAMRNIYPDTDYWSARQLPHGFWKKRANRIRFLRWAYRQLLAKTEAGELEGPDAVKYPNDFRLTHLENRGILGKIFGITSGTSFPELMSEAFPNDYAPRDNSKIRYRIYRTRKYFDGVDHDFDKLRTRDLVRKTDTSIPNLDDVIRHTKVTYGVSSYYTPFVEAGLITPENYDSVKAVMGGRFRLSKEGVAEIAEKSQQLLEDALPKRKSRVLSPAEQARLSAITSGIGDITEEDASLYAEVVRDMANAPAAVADAVVDYLRRRMGDFNGTVWLDVAGGTGAAGYAIRRVAPDDAVLYFVADKSDAMLCEAIDAVDLMDGGDILQCDIKDGFPELTDGSFDVVYCGFGVDQIGVTEGTDEQLIEGANDVVKFLDGAYRILRNDGRLVITLPENYVVDERMTRQLEARGYHVRTEPGTYVVGERVGRRIVTVKGEDGKPMEKVEEFTVEEESPVIIAEKADKPEDTPEEGEVYLRKNGVEKQKRGYLPPNFEKWAEKGKIVIEIGTEGHLVRREKPKNPDSLSRAMSGRQVHDYLGFESDDQEDLWKYTQKYGFEFHDGRDISETQEKVTLKDTSGRVYGTVSITPQDNEAISEAYGKEGLSPDYEQTFRLRKKEEILRSRLSDLMGIPIE